MKPLAAPATTCQNVCRSIAILDVPNIPAMNIAAQIIGNKSNIPSPSALMRHIKAMNPPIPAMCALIFHLKFIIIEINAAHPPPNMNIQSQSGELIENRYIALAT